MNSLLQILLTKFFPLAEYHKRPIAWDSLVVVLMNPLGNASRFAEDEVTKDAA
jgi:hypothetical protein